jgi:UrcA family protein
VKNLFIASIAAAAAFLSAANAAPTSRVVKLDDLNLTRPAGAEVALRRISNSAESVCGGYADIRDLSMAAATRDCVSETIDQAVLDLASPLVTSMRHNHSSIIDIARR